jgi:hypothetical protein
MIECIKYLIDLAQARHFQVYFSLLNGWDVRPEVPEQFTNIVHRVNKYYEWIDTISKILKKIVKEPDDYCNKVIFPLANLVRHNPSVYAVDLMNEPEGLIEGTGFGMNAAVSENILRIFLNKCAGYFKGVGVPCTTGWMRWNNAIKNSDLMFDFIDFHHYAITGIILPYISALFHNKKCIIGECRYPVNKNDEYNRRMHGFRVASSIISNAKGAGFAGALAWPIEGPRMEMENENLLAWLKQYSSSSK